MSTNGCLLIMKNIYFKGGKRDFNTYIYGHLKREEKQER